MDILVIGGGPAGMMAAIHAVRGGAKVRLLEGNDRIGKKLLATGNGKCNLTNRDEDLAHYYSHDAGCLPAVFSAFSFADTRHFFENAGIVFKERNGWLYPYAEQAQAVLAVLERMLQQEKVTIKTREKVTAIEKTQDGFLVKTETWQYSANRVIVTTGGPASAIEGSSDTGMQLVRSLGHTLYPPIPALVPLKIREKAYGVWVGTRMDATAVLLIDGVPTARERGEIQFTEYGISGIAVFQLSIRALLAVEEGKKVQICLDLMPDFSAQELTDLLESRRDTLSVSREADLFTGLLPDRMIRALIGKSNRSATAYASMLKGLTVTVTAAHSMARAQVANGGIALSEITVPSMASKKLPGLYLAGEVLDVCGTCGGYNLQWAWSSGALAGIYASRQEENQ